MKSTHTGPERSGERVNSWLARFGPWLLAALALFLLLPGTRTFPLLDLDEPTHAERAREMMEADEWVVPLVNGQPDLEKPPLAFWLMGASYALFGVNEFAARFPSVLATVGLVLVVYATGRSWFSARVGFAAALGLLTCLEVPLVGRAAMTDMPMVLSVAVVQCACFHLMRHTGPRYPWGWFAALYGALALGSLAKGPVAVAVVVLTLLTYRFVLWRQPIAWRNFRLALGLPLSVAIVAVWAVPAWIETHGLVWEISIWQQVVRRGMEPFDGRPRFFGYYGLAAFASLMPWIAFAGQGWEVLRQRWTDTNAWLASWFLGLHVAMSLYASQLPHYVLPSFPAFFLIVAQIADTRQPPGKWAKAWFWFVMSLYVLCVAGIGLFCFTTEFAPRYATLRTVVLSIAVLIAGLACLGLCYRLRWHPGIGIALVVIAAVPPVLGEALREIIPAVRLQALIAPLPPEAECVAYGFERPSVLFYSHCRWVFPSNLDELRTMAHRPGARVLVLVESRIEARDYLRQRFGDGAPPRATVRDWMTELDASNYQIRRIEGIDSLRPAWIRLMVLYRK